MRNARPVSPRAPVLVKWRMFPSESVGSPFLGGQAIVQHLHSKASYRWHGWQLTG